ncbi:MAG: DUF2723 domain-containing protein [Polyangiaceae bacterium]|nr:DUF2723 domain-containing protein [Polyangiaceae bacterium]
MATKEKKRRKSDKARGRPSPPADELSSPVVSSNQTPAVSEPVVPAVISAKPESVAGQTRPLTWFTPNRSALFVGAISFFLYLLTLAPSVTCEDSGELITAAATGGVAHPPGYPVYTMAARFFTALPIGNIAYRVNLMSAVFGALTAALTVLVAHEIAAFRTGANSGKSASPVIAPMMAGLFVAGSRDFWAQSVIAEVYTLNGALLAASLLCLLRGTRLQKTIYLPMVGALTGLSLAHHYPLALLALPSLVVFLFRGQKPLLKHPAWVAYSAFLVAFGLTAYLYLWAVAQSAPALNWGEPSTAARLWEHVTRSAYRKAEFQGDLSLSDKLSFAGLFLRLWTTQWTPPVLLVFLPLGIYKLRDLPTVRDLLLGIIGLTAFGLIVIPGYPYNAENIQRFDELYLPVYLASALIMAEGATALVSYLELRMKDAQRPLWIATASAAIFPVIMHFSYNDLSEHDLAEKYNRAALNQLEPNALYLTSGDYTSFPALYLHVVEGLRPDVILANFTGDLSKSR